MSDESTPPSPTPPTATRSEIILTPQQEFAVGHIVDFVKKRSANPNGTKQFFRLGGYAGTGKTTCQRVVVDRLRSEKLLAQPCAFTGKAVSVLRRKGLYDSKTIHSIIYRPVEVEKNVFEFRLKSRGEILDEGMDYFLVDEASMISKQIFDDLVSIGLPIVFVGDPGQLEPVGDDPNLMRNPDFVLTDIHRQALESPIVKFSIAARAGKLLEWQTGSKTEKDFSFVSIYQKTTEKQFTRELDLALQVDQIIVPTNRERCLLNKLIRQRLGFSGTLQPGERVICLENNRQHSVFNGQILTVAEVRTDRYDDDMLVISGSDDAGNRFSNLPCPKWMFGELYDKKRPMPQYDKRTTTLFDYAYAMTCHKSQGSEWDRVLVLETWFPPHLFDMKRWTYTAITRAAKELHYGRKF